MNCLISALACRPRARRRRGGGSTDVMIIAPSAPVPRGPRNSSPSRSLYPVRTGDRRDSFTIFEAPQLGSNKSRGSNVWFKAGWSESASQGPCRDRDPEPCRCGQNKRQRGRSLDQEPNDASESGQPDTPSVAPAASSAAASFPRRAPAKLERCLCSRAAFQSESRSPEKSPGRPGTGRRPPARSAKR
jgi:hypothetical protein